MDISINLLPKNKKEEISQTKQFRTVLGWELVLVFIFLLFSTFLFGVNYLIGVNAEAIAVSGDGETDQVQLEAVKKYEEKFVNINNRLSVLAKVDQDQLYWTELFLKLNQATPENITITNLSTREFWVLLVGKATTRDDLLSYKDKLMAENCFSNVTLPLSNLVSKDNIDFQIDFKINSDCLKRK